MRKLTEEESYKVRDQLLTKWGYDGLEWEPFQDKSPQKTIFIIESNLTKSDWLSILNAIQGRAKEKLYLISPKAEYEVDTSDFLWNLSEEICCDDTFDWVVYSSLFAALTFGGDWLLKHIYSLYSDRKDLLNNWGETFI